jgi:hypothetical protein
VQAITPVRAARLLALMLALMIPPATPALAAQSVKLAVSLTPERLGAGTTIIFSFQIAAPPGQVPPPLTAIDLLYPANIGLITSGLGLATCEAATLETLGPEGCPPDSLMGHGRAVVEIPVGPEIIHETGQITTWMAPIEEGHLQLLFYAEGRTPVSAQLIFTGRVLEAPTPFGGSLDTRIPIIPSLPGAPTAAIVQMHATIGPQDITYYHQSHGKQTSYHPTGITLPDHCPHPGFPFAATFAFLDGTQTSAHTNVPCPARRFGTHGWYP